MQKFSLPFHMVYGKKNPDLLYVLYLGYCTNHIKVVVFRKYFSRSLMDIYGLISSSFDILIYFNFLLSFRQKKSVPKTLF